MPLQEFIGLTLKTNQGNVGAHYYPVESTQAAVIWVGGAGGGWDSPAQDLYSKLSRQFQTEGIASLRLKFRHSTILEASVLDVLGGLDFLEHEGIKGIGLVGHSFGGAVVIQAAARSQKPKTVITLATQSYGTDAASALPRGCSILLLHGDSDRVLPVRCSEQIYRIAHEPKELIIYRGNDHGLSQSAREVQQKVHDWLYGELQPQ